MRMFQYMGMTAKSGATVTLEKLSNIAARFEPAPPDGTAHPVYLGNDLMVITTTLATADATFWGCPGYFKVTVERVT